MKCSNCGREIKKEERFCPYCGSENKKTKKKNKWLTGVMGLIVVCIILGIVAGAMNSNKKEDAKKIQHLTQRKQQKNRQLQRVRKLLQVQKQLVQNRRKTTHKMQMINKMKQKIQNIYYQKVIQDT